MFQPGSCYGISPKLALQYGILHSWVNKRMPRFPRPCCKSCTYLQALWDLWQTRWQIQQVFSKHFGFPCQMSLQLLQFINHPITDAITSVPTALLNNQLQRIISKKTSWMYKPSYFEGVSSQGYRRIYYVRAFLQWERTKFIPTKHNCIVLPYFP
jgi:hypothetical protein